MLSAFNEERGVPDQQHAASLVIAWVPLELVRKVPKGGFNVWPGCRSLSSFIPELSREELLDCATMKTKKTQCC